MTNKLNQPSGWTRHFLGELGRTYNGLSGKTKEDFGKGKPFITYLNIFNNSSIKLSEFALVDIQNNEKQNEVKYGDVFFTTSSETPDEVGMASVLLANTKETFLNSFCFGFRLNSFNVIKPEFARYLFRGDIQRKAICRLAQGSTRYNLSKIALCNELSFYLPPLPEQKKIAAILSSVDDAIEKTERLIQKLKDLKTAVMQELFTKGIGHTEFKNIDSWKLGCPTDQQKIPKTWDITKITDVAKLESGHTPSRKVTEYWNGSVQWLSLHDTNNLKQRVINKTVLTVTKDGISNSSARILPVGTVAFSRTASVGHCVIMGVDMATSQDFANYICGEKLYNRYLLHLFRWMNPVWKSLSSGSTHQTVYMPIFKELQIALPPISEQKLIAGVIDTIDNRLEILFKKSYKFNELKKSLMQSLLTGKVRVKV